MKHIWSRFSGAFTVVGLVTLALYFAPIPFFDHNSTTLVMPNQHAHACLARALAETIGEPTATLNTSHIRRYLFGDGTSVDFLPTPPTFKPMYQITSLKTITLGFFSGKSPIVVAEKMATLLHLSGFKIQIVTRPDPAFPKGSIVLLLSTAFLEDG